MDVTKELAGIKEALGRIENRLNVGEKKMLTVNEAAELLMISPDRVYKLVSLCELPCYRNKCRRIWFDRAELEAWMKSERITPDYELMEQAAEYTAKNDRRLQHG